MLTNQLRHAGSGERKMTSIVNISKRPSFRAAVRKNLREGHEISEKDTESAISECTTTSMCDESLSSRSSIDHTMYSTSAYTASIPQILMQQGATHLLLPQANMEINQQLNQTQPQQMPMQLVLPCPDSAAMGQLPVTVGQLQAQMPIRQPQLYVQPHAYGSMIMQQNQFVAPGHVPMSNNVWLTRNVSDLGNNKHPGIQENYNAQPVTKRISTDMCSVAGSNSPLQNCVSSPGYANANCSPTVMYYAPQAPTIWIPTTQINAFMPQVAIPSPPNMPDIPSANQEKRGCVYPNLRGNISPDTLLSSPSSLQLAHSPANTLSDHTTQSQFDEDEDEEVTRNHGTKLEQGDSVWVGSCTYEEYRREGGSNLFITWPGSYLGLLNKLAQVDLKPKIIYRTCDKKIYNVVWKSHTIARRAFAMQREIRLRMVPPKYSRRNWLRNPSPRFLVKYETTSRLVIRKGKSTCHEIAGSFLMSCCKERRGCYIWADQLKGNRIRIVGFEGKFMYPDKKVVIRKEIPCEGKANVPIGWVSYRNKRTKKDFVHRLSGNLLRDYLYWG